MLVIAPALLGASYVAGLLWLMVARVATGPAARGRRLGPRHLRARRLRRTQRAWPAWAAENLTLDERMYSGAAAWPSNRKTIRCWHDGSFLHDRTW